MHNLEMAKWYANEFAAYLKANAGNSDIFEYPKSERLVTDEGRKFFDS
jgi:S-ribosylhomocysteine lyase